MKYKMKLNLIRVMSKISRISPLCSLLLNSRNHLHFQSQHSWWNQIWKRIKMIALIMKIKAILWMIIQGILGWFKVDQIKTKF